MLVGREQECRLLNELTGQKKNILILGPEGVGKTAIVDHVLAEGQMKDVLRSKSSTSLKETLVNMIQSAFGSKDLQKKNILTLKKICCELLDQSPEYVVLDHVAWVEPRFYGFLTYLKERKIPLIIVARKADKGNVGRLWMGLYDFKKLEIKNLEEPNTGRLVDCYIARFDLKMETVTDFKKAIFKISGGNPKIIKELCDLARDEKYRAKGYTDVKLMDLDRRIKSSIH